jgi:hypothetical protein
MPAKSKKQTYANHIEYEGTLDSVRGHGVSLFFTTIPGQATVPESQK